jgi:hypothetical protein
MRCCPTCKQPLPASDELLIDAANSVVQRGGLRTYIPAGMSVRILQILHAAYPGPVTLKRIIGQLYGDAPDGGPLSAENAVRVYLCKLRPALRSVGVRIDCVRPFGYLLVMEPPADRGDMEKAA